MNDMDRMECNSENSEKRDQEQGKKRDEKHVSSDCRNQGGRKRHPRRNPEFLCMGFQKCGTTTLFEILKQHREVVLCRDVKEPMYYRVQGLWFIGRQRYYQWRYYGHIAPDDTRRCGEINAGLTFTGCAKKICRDFSPDTKLIFMMRNPVDRAYSSYKYFLARGFLPKGAVLEDRKYGHAEAFDRYVHSVLDDPAQERQIMRKRLKYLVFSQSCYSTCIQEYLDFFPKENIRLVFFEEFVQDEKAACRELFDFIGIGEDESVDYSIRANEGNERAFSDSAAKRFQIIKGFHYGFYEFAALPYWLPNAYKKFRGYYDRKRQESFLPDEDKSAMLPKTREYLEAYFAEEVRGIERLSGRNLDSLWYPAGQYPEKAQSGKHAAHSGSLPEDAA
ncbi:MAG: sulfotransferase domain-containing protein [Clostridiales bacterium]|nr:sulfotransferase domain-containing protein [Clostridiales bacterium]